jgi:hypothetical protein
MAVAKNDVGIVTTAVDDRNELVQIDHTERGNL